MSIETIKVIMPSHWASYIINGDASIFDYIGEDGDREQRYVDEVLEEYANNGWHVSGDCSGESFFSPYPDHSFGGLAEDCFEYELYRIVS